MIKRLIGNLIKQKLSENFNESLIEVINESHLHGKGENSHFKILIVSNSFEGLNSVNRRRSVYHKLNEFWAQGVHSISLHTFTESEYNGKRPGTIGCLSQKNKD